MSIYYKRLPGLVPYSSALALQDRLIAAKPNIHILLLLEHSPVYTVGRRIKDENAEEISRLRNLGADYQFTLRGGQITFHGPGQLVGYPIFNLARMQLSVRNYVDLVEKSLIRMLADQYAIRGITSEHTGVWLDDVHKIASIGVQVRHRITSHGFAINITNEPLDPWFSSIVACGIHGAKMTSVASTLKDNSNSISMHDATHAAAKAIGNVFGMHVQQLDDPHLDAIISDSLNSID
ncbi:hypothetical protein J056_000107 [Wallemia ichthyophaga EXF-994]|uniref:Octanoyltransferase n=1 Tax=Wallemia ichthyophaga (strain EXF-994 / CBS 113033) TaxID=1299270 RepID=R9ARD8_WALI9|nr:uncharacterized protein J056_000107 [Wallemia ichthyophaga EXF-994]EOR04767.1 hypothetical protein J056_000107 [Wallemia ichthyophaga EXF-994]